jgi:hypothetical protein
MTLDWMSQARCLDHDPALWDNDPGGAWRQGRRICHGCPVQIACLEYAQANEGITQRQSRGMIYAGLTPAQRTRLATKGKAGTPEVRPAGKPTPPECRGCGRLIRPERAPIDGRARHQGRGLCQPCWREEREAS